MTRPSAQRPPRSHLQPGRLASLSDPEKDLLLHVATCGFCRQIAAHELGAAPKPAALVEARCARAQRLLDLRNTAAAALEIQRAALELVCASPVAAATGQLGLALALLETTTPGTLETAEVDSVLAAAHQAIAAVDEPLTRLRLRWLAAHLFRRGRRWSALRRLLRILAAFVNLSEDHDAARVLLDLLTLCPEHQWLKILARPELRRAFAVLGASTALHRRARNVLAFLPYVVHLPRSCAGEVLLRARSCLETSRYLSALPFQPTDSQPVLFLDWDELDPVLRRTICREIEADETAAHLASWQIEVGLQETISWRYEVLQRTRIVFTGCRAEPRPWR